MSPVKKQYRFNTFSYPHYLAFFKCKYSLVLLLIHVTNPWKRKRMRKWGFYEYFFSTLTLIYKWKEHQLFFFSIWINGWSINQSSVEYQQKSLIIAFSNTVESKLALRRPWQDYRPTELSNKTCHGAGSL